MKIYILFTFLLTYVSCAVENNDQGQNYGLWTDKIFSDSTEKEIYINEVYVGNIIVVENIPTCDSPHLLSYEFKYSTPSQISYLGQSGELIEIATITIHKSNSGIHIKTKNNSTIDIDETTYNECSMIYLSW